MKMQITEHPLFNLPIYQVTLPGFSQYHDEVVELFEGLIRSGQLKAHENGYGYQTSTDLLLPESYGKRYFHEHLAPGFTVACKGILERTRVELPPNQAWVNTLTVGWANVQTREQFEEESPWHDHLPATLSGCYYVSTATGDEGNLQFLNPLMDNIFMPPSIEFTPQPGDLIIFPSFLRHRPGRCPNTRRTRVSLCMDSYWTIRGAGVEASGGRGTGDG